MYDINKRKELTGMTVMQLIEELAKLPQDANVYCGGCESVWLHVEKNGNAVSIDYDDLDWCYKED